MAKMEAEVRESKVGNTTSTTEVVEKWMTVGNRGKKKLEGTGETVRPKHPPTKEQLLRKRRPHQEAVIIASKMEGGKYANIIRKAKSLVSP